LTFGFYKIAVFFCFWVPDQVRDDRELCLISDQVRDDIAFLSSLLSFLDVILKICPP